jgi:hypothetical protein
MKSFLDLLQNDLLESSIIGQLTLTGVLSALILSLIAGLVIYLVYKYAFSGTMFINNFGITLVGLSMVTCLIILTITSNLLLSLGMVGALSIVRFRTVIKEPIDMIFMFWSIATGIAVGAGFFMLAGLGLIVISIVLIALSKYTIQNDLYILVIRHDILRADLETILKSKCKSFRFRATTLYDELKELTYELRMKDSDLLVKELTEQGIKDISLVSYNSNTLV